MRTHLLSRISNAFWRGSFSSWNTFSPRWAKQSSIEVSGLAGLNTGDVWQSKPVLLKAEDTEEAIYKMYLTTSKKSLITSKKREIECLSISGC